MSASIASRKAVVVSGSSPLPKSELLLSELLSELLFELLSEPELLPSLCLASSASFRADDSWTEELFPTHLSDRCNRHMCKIGFNIHL